MVEVQIDFLTSAKKIGVFVRVFQQTSTLFLRRDRYFDKRPNYLNFKESLTV